MNQTDILLIREETNRILDELDSHIAEECGLLFNSLFTDKRGQIINICKTPKEYIYSKGLISCFNTLLQDILNDYYSDKSITDEYVLNRLEDVLETSIKEIKYDMLSGVIINNIINYVNKYKNYVKAYISDDKVLKTETGYTLHLNDTLTNNVIIPRFQDFIQNLLKDCMFIKNNIDRYENHKTEVIFELCLLAQECDTKELLHPSYKDSIEEYSEMIGIFMELLDNNVIYDADKDARYFMRYPQELLNLFTEPDMEDYKANIINLTMDYYLLVKQILSNIETYRKDREDNFLSLYVLTNLTSTPIDLNQSTAIRELDLRFHCLYELLKVEDKTYRYSITTDYIDIISVQHYRDIIQLKPITEYIYKAIIAEDYMREDNTYLADFNNYPGFSSSTDNSFLELLGTDYLNKLIKIVQESAHTGYLDDVNALIKILCTTVSARTEQYIMAYNNYPDLLPTLIEEINNLYSIIQTYKDEIIYRRRVSRDNREDSNLFQYNSYIVMLLKLVQGLDYNTFEYYGNNIIKVVANYLTFVANYKMVEFKLLNNNKYYVNISEDKLISFIEEFFYKDSYVKETLIKGILAYMKQDYNNLKKVFQYLTKAQCTVNMNEGKYKVYLSASILLNFYDVYSGKSTLMYYIEDDYELVQALREVELGL